MKPTPVRVFACLFVVTVSCSRKTKHPGALFPVAQGGKWGYIDKTGEMVIEPRFDFATRFCEGLAGVRIGNKQGFIDAMGEFAVEPSFAHTEGFSEGMAAVSNGMYWGYVDKTGKVVIEPRFLIAEPFHEGLAVVAIGEWLGAIDRSGRVVVEPRFYALGDFSDGLAFGLMRRESGCEKVYVDRDGRVATRPKINMGGNFSEGRARVEISEKWGYIGRKGKIVIEPQFDDAWDFSEGLAAVRVGEKWGYIDTAGRAVIEPRFDDAWRFSEGMAAVSIGGKWGYIDVTGNVAIEPRFDDAWRFSNGLAEVRVEGKHGYIDRASRYVWKPTALPAPKEEKMEPEEYAVCSAVVDHTYSNLEALVVIERETRLEGPRDSIVLFGLRGATLERVKREMPGVEQSTLDDLAVKPNCALENRFDTKLNYVFLDEEFPGWEEFEMRYSGGEDIPIHLLALSRVGFNGDGTQALVFIECDSGSGSGTGKCLLLKKARGAWKVQSSFNLWIE